MAKSCSNYYELHLAQMCALLITVSEWTGEKCALD